MSWSRRTMRHIKSLYTVIVMLAVRTVTTRSHHLPDSIRDGAGKFSSLMSFATLTPRRVAASITDLSTSIRQRIRKNPLLFWIPVFSILLILASVAYWLQLQSRIETDDTTTGPSDRTSFSPHIMSSVSKLTLSIINGISQIVQSLTRGMTSRFLVVRNTLQALWSWLVTACFTFLHTTWVATSSTVVQCSNLISLPFHSTSEDSKVIPGPPSSPDSRFVENAKIQASDENTSIQIHKGQPDHVEQHLETPLMDSVLERVMVELQKQQDRTHDQVTQQVQLQVEKAAAMLSEEMIN